MFYIKLFPSYHGKQLERGTEERRVERRDAETAGPYRIPERGDIHMLELRADGIPGCVVPGCHCALEPRPESGSTR